MWTFSRVLNAFRCRTLLEKAFLFLVLLELFYGIVYLAGSVRLPGSDLVRFLFIVVAVVILIRSFPKLIRRLPWRVRHRLIVTYIFMGVVPMALILALVTNGLYILMGQVAGYMVTSELARRMDAVRNAGDALAWIESNREPATDAQDSARVFVDDRRRSGLDSLGALVRTGRTEFEIDGEIGFQAFPAWSKSDFTGLVSSGDRFFIASGGTADGRAGKTEVFVHQPASPEFFRQLLPDMAVIEVFGIRGDDSVRSGSIRIGRSTSSSSGIRFSVPQDPNPISLDPPPGRGWWDRTVGWVVPIQATAIETGKEEQTFATIVSRPSLIVGKLFSTLGDLATIAAVLLLLLTGALLVVEIISLALGLKLTRSITRAVADLHEGTQKVQAGDFSHRIPVRTKDQLSELAGSFNQMTDEIERHDDTTLVLARRR